MNTKPGGVLRILLPLICAALAGCQVQGGSEPVEVTALSGDSHCGSSQPRLELITDAANLPSAGREQGLAVIDGGGAVLVVDLGRRPTAGYSAELYETALSNERLTLTLKPTEPDPDAMVAQVITTPCVVLEIPSSGWSRLEVRMDAEGFPLTLEHPNPG